MISLMRRSRTGVKRTRLRVVLLISGPEHGAKQTNGGAPGAEIIRLVVIMLWSQFYSPRASLTFS